LIKALDDPVYAVSKQACHTLAWYRSHTKLIFPALIRKIAAETGVAFQPKKPPAEWVPLLLRYLAPKGGGPWGVIALGLIELDVAGRLIEYLDDEDDKIRFQATSFLIRKENIPRLIKVLETGSLRARQEAAQVLGLLFKKSRRAVPTLLRALDDESAEMRSTAILALADFDPSQRVIKAMTGLLKDQSENIRSTVVWLLSRQGKRSLPLLREAMNDPSAKVRAGAKQLVFELTHTSPQEKPSREERRRGHEGDLIQYSLEYVKQRDEYDQLLAQSPVGNGREEEGQHAALCRECGERFLNAARNISGSLGHYEAAGGKLPTDPSHRLWSCDDPLRRRLAGRYGLDLLFPHKVGDRRKRRAK